jgi:murein DD-endopeptidase MepM/ murein hydrolase activator NlpD
MTIHKHSNKGSSSHHAEANIHRHGHASNDDRDGDHDRGHGSHHHRQRPTREELAKIAAEKAEARAESARKEKEAALRAAERRRREAERVAADREFKSVNEPLVEAAIAKWRAHHVSSATPRETPINPLGMDARVTSPFGPRSRGGLSELHIGTDFVPIDSSIADVPLVAAVSGQALFVGQWNVKSGNVVMIGGADGTIYTYSHLRDSSTGPLKAGDTVLQGQSIAVMGNTGEGTGPHLHFVIRKPLSMDEMLQDAREQAIKGGADVAADPEIPQKLLKDSYPGKTLEQILEVRRLDFQSYEAVDPKMVGRVLSRGLILSRNEHLGSPPIEVARAMSAGSMAEALSPMLAKSVSGGVACNEPMPNCNAPSAKQSASRGRF